MSLYTSSLMALVWIQGLNTGLIVACGGHFWMKADRFFFTHSFICSLFHLSTGQHKATNMCRLSAVTVGGER